MNRHIEERIQCWLEWPDPAVQEEIKRLQKEQPDALIDAFYRELSFGTGGMRGIMGIGTNRINIYTIRFATQGLANALLKQPRETKARVFIGYDVRHHSRLFAQETARVLAGNGIEALITQEVCPTPLVSFACRFYGCNGAVVITASHNPPQYNGYKVYWSDGGQIVPPQDAEIMEEVRLIHDIHQVNLASLDDPLIQWIGEEIDGAYLAELDRLQLISSPKTANILYTNLHGTGLRLVPKALLLFGFKDVHLMQQQISFDGNFPTVSSPNPEEEEALSLGSKTLLDIHGDVLLATDPDADRLGLVVRVKDSAIRLNGNEIACVALAHFLRCLHAKGELPSNGAIVKTIVTTELLRKIATSYSVECCDTLTGFKYIGELIREWEKSFGGFQFLFGAEESHGMLYGTFVRDKDAISASCLLAEAAEMAKRNHHTLIDELYELYRLHGVHQQLLETLAFDDSPKGIEQMQTLMGHLREDPPHAIGKIPVMSLSDYLLRVSIDITSSKRHPLSLPVSDVLHFCLEDGSKLIIRPSGTEPKIKIYTEVCEEPSHDVKASIARALHRLKEINQAIQESFKQAL